MTGLYQAVSALSITRRHTSPWRRDPALLAKLTSDGRIRQCSPQPVVGQDRLSPSLGRSARVAHAACDRPGVGSASRRHVGGPSMVRSEARTKNTILDVCRLTLRLAYLFNKPDRFEDVRTSASPSVRTAGGPDPRSSSLRATVPWSPPSWGAWVRKTNWLGERGTRHVARDSRGGSVSCSIVGIGMNSRSSSSTNHWNPQRSEKAHA